LFASEQSRGDVYNRAMKKNFYHFKDLMPNVLDAELCDDGVYRVPAIRETATWKTEYRIPKDWRSYAGIDFGFIQKEMGKQMQADIDRQIRSLFRNSF
jgi:hypothetical protein